MKVIKNWEELSKIAPNDKYKIIVNKCYGWIVPLCDKHDDKNGYGFVCNCKNQYGFYNDHVYLSTYTFYGEQYKYSTSLLKKYGFDVEIDNWNKVCEIE